MKTEVMKMRRTYTKSVRRSNNNAPLLNKNAISFSHDARILTTMNRVRIANNDAHRFREIRANGSLTKQGMHRKTFDSTLQFIMLLIELDDEFGGSDASIPALLVQFAC